MIVNDKSIQIIEKYLCTRKDSNSSIYDLMQKLLLFELVYETINQRFIKKETAGSLLESQLLNNYFLISYIYVQSNVLAKLLDYDKRTISFINLWQETKDLLKQDEKYFEIKNQIESLQNNKCLKKIKTIRDTIICHNDENSNLKVLVDIREAVILIFKIYGYFSSFITNKFDFLIMREESFLEDEIEKLTHPLFNKEQEKEEFRQNYKKVLEEFGLKYMTVPDIHKLMKETVKFEIKTHLI